LDQDKWHKSATRSEFEITGAPPLQVLTEFPAILASAIQIEPMGNAGGFSGAMLWKLHQGEETLCLRRWPAEHPDHGTLETMHALLRHVADHGFSLVPVPRHTKSGATWLKSEGRFWELTPWLPGEANYHREPHERKLTGALAALAEFHRAAASFSPPRYLPSPGLQQRAQQLQFFLTRQAAELPRAMAKLAWPEFSRQGELLLPEILHRGPAILAELERWRRRPVLLQFALRDIWHDHLLFTDLKVSGLVDFGAMRVESPCGDVARLLGSLVGSDPLSWERGLRAYHEVRALSPDERRLVSTFDRSGVLLGAVNWLVWIALERRQFDDPGRVLARLSDLGRRFAAKQPCSLD
jgi:Ser/Thr protein kinase RdoA (MazF antagonist)